MNLLDALLIAVAVSFAVIGYHRGFIIGVFSIVGFLGGAVIGLLVIPDILSHLTPSALTTALAWCGVLFLAGVGQTLAAVIGVRLQRSITWQPARIVDAGGGAVVSAVAVLLLSWLLGTVVVYSAVPWLPNEVRQSVLLRGVTNVMPQSAQTWFSDFYGVLERSGMPPPFAPFATEPVINVPPPDPNVTASAGVKDAENSVVKVLGTAPSCGKEIEGTGFYYTIGSSSGTSHRVMTNAHVVAGVQHPRVYPVGSSRGYAATVVLFDPTVDIAILDVPDLGRKPLTFDTSGSANDSGVVMGYPENGGLTLVPARIRGTLSEAGPNIWGQGLSVRQFYALYARVLPGNSGGPLLSPSGDVYGVVFAKSQDDDNTGYALTAHQVAGDAQTGATATQPVGTAGCAL